MATSALGHLAPAYAKRVNGGLRSTPPVSPGSDQVPVRRNATFVVLKSMVAKANGG